MKNRWWTISMHANARAFDFPPGSEGRDIWIDIGWACSKLGQEWEDQH